MAPENSATASDREIVLSRVFDAPRALVWQAFTDPAHLPKWWGPSGFTNTTQSFDLRPGGTWQFVMHGPDGQDYPNLITFLEVSRHQRLRYKHGGSTDLEPVNHEVTVTLEPEAGSESRTRVTLHSVFVSKNARDFVVREYNAIEGGKQHLGRLAEYLGSMRRAAAGDEQAMEGSFVAARVFHAPRELLWRAWTEREHLMRWFGPKGVKIVACTLELRPDGAFHYGMQTPDGQTMWGKWVFREVVPLERLVFVASFSDAEGGIARHPLAADWPLEMLSRTTLSEHAGRGGGTTLVIEWRPLNATPAERARFAASHASMQQGWAGTLEQLSAYVAERVAAQQTP